MNKFIRNKYFVVGTLVLIMAISVLIVIYITANQKEAKPIEKTTRPEPTQETAPATVPPKAVSEPISNAKTRISKKPFGIYITPQNSPVQPERFTGYHTGTDFETTSQEAHADVSIHAICTGKIRVRQIVSGYGGAIVQDCVLEGQEVTILYGHLNINGVSVPSIGTEVKSGDRIGALAPANSEYSGGERKHLHLGIHKGTEIDYRGYVQSQPELSSWLDVGKYL